MVRIRKALSADDRRQRIRDRLIPVANGLALARPFGLTERGRWLERWLDRNYARYERVRR